MHFRQRYGNTCCKVVALDHCIKWVESRDGPFPMLCITLFILFYLSSKPWLYLTLLLSLFSVFLLIVVTLFYDYFLFSHF